jgi:wyosine [tRNA(Phe)-imidazoG37] synthetase (radical SAM superfamily)
MTLPPLERIVYGPVRSRRLGASLGINLLPAGIKVCNMNCVYCQFGWTRGAGRNVGRIGGWPTPQAVESAVATRLIRAAEGNEVLDRLTIAGHGEPTLHPKFEEIATRLCRIRDRVAPDIPIAILSNSTTAVRTDVRRGLEAIDECYMKLDAGDPFTLRAVNGARVSFADLIAALRGLPSVIVQAMFVSDADGCAGNDTDSAVSQWLAAIEQVRAKAVHVYSLDRAPALSSLRPVSTRRLREIAERVRAAGIPAEVFP